MNLREILLRKLDSILNPKIENKFIIGFLSLGILLVGVPSILAFTASFSVTNGDTTFNAEISNGPDLTFIIIGVCCLIIAIYFYIRKLKNDESLNKNSNTFLDEKDNTTIIYIMNTINTNVFDEAIERGRYSQFYDPILHYYIGIEGLAKSSAFKIYDDDLSSKFNDFYCAFRAFISHGAHFRQTSHPDLHRMAKAHEVGDWDKHEKHENAYLSDVETFSHAYSKFIGFVKDNYPVINLDDSNKEAQNDYLSYNKI